MALRRSDEGPVWGWHGSPVEKTRAELCEQLRRQGIDPCQANDAPFVPPSAFKRESEKSSGKDESSQNVSDSRVQGGDPAGPCDVSAPLADGAQSRCAGGRSRVPTSSGQPAASDGRQGSDPGSHLGRDAPANSAQPCQSRPASSRDGWPNGSDSFAQSCPGSVPRGRLGSASNEVEAPARGGQPRDPNEGNSEGPKTDYSHAQHCACGQCSDAGVTQTLADFVQSSRQASNPRQMPSRQTPRYSQCDRQGSEGSSSSGAVRGRQSAKRSVSADGYGNAEQPTSSDGHGRGLPAENPDAGGALLDTRGITRQPPRKSKGSKGLDLSSQRSEWQRELRALTAPHRTARARALRAVARKRRAMARDQAVLDAAILRLDGNPAAEGYFDASRDRRKKVGKWHEDRAKGQEFRFENVESCGQTGVVVANCQECGQTLTPHRVTCGTAMLCVPCRGRLAQIRRARLTRARTALALAARRAGLNRRSRHGGAWQESLITLTIPHRFEDGIAQRIEFVRAAWPHFIRFLRRKTHVDESDLPLLHWYAAHEWTVGDDRQGHPHIHVYFFGPRMDHAVLLDLWRRALETVHFGAPILPENALPNADARWEYAGPLVVDIKAVRPGPKSSAEVVKYVVKDIDDGALIDANLYAQVYCAIDGKRTHQGSRGFLKLGDRPIRCDCGTEKPYFVRVYRCACATDTPSDLGIEPGFS